MIEEPYSDYILALEGLLYALEQDQEMIERYRRGMRALPSDSQIPKNVEVAFLTFGTKIGDFDIACGERTRKRLETDVTELYEILSRYIDPKPYYGQPKQNPGPLRDETWTRAPRTRLALEACIREVEYEEKNRFIAAAKEAKRKNDEACGTQPYTPIFGNAEPDTPPVEEESSNPAPADEQTQDTNEGK